MGKKTEAIMLYSLIRTGVFAALIACASSSLTSEVTSYLAENGARIKELGRKRLQASDEWDRWLGLNSWSDEAERAHAAKWLNSFRACYDEGLKLWELFVKCRDGGLEKDKRLPLIKELVTLDCHTNRGHHDIKLLNDEMGPTGWAQLGVAQADINKALADMDNSRRRLLNETALNETALLRANGAAHRARGDNAQ